MLLSDTKRVEEEEEKEEEEKEEEEEEGLRSHATGFWPKLERSIRRC